MAPLPPAHSRPRSPTGIGSMESTSSTHADRQWFIVGRWQEYEGESRANLLRVVAVGAFYSLQLVHHHLLAAPAERDAKFHHSATLIAVAAVLLSLAVHLALRRRFFPAGLKYVSTLLDVLLVTAVAALGSGPTSPTRLAWFVVIALSGLRFQLPLVWCATLSAMASYLFLVGRVDRGWFDSEHAVPPIEQLMTLATLGLTGIVTGQIVRRVRSIAQQFADRTRVESQSGGRS